MTHFRIVSKKSELTPIYEYFDLLTNTLIYWIKEKALRE